MVQHPDFDSVVAEAWNTNVEGCPLMRVWEKLKLVKQFVFFTEQEPVAWLHPWSSGLGHVDSQV